MNTTSISSLLYHSLIALALPVIFCLAPSAVRAESNPTIYSDAGKTQAVAVLDGTASTYVVHVPLTSENIKPVFKFPTLQYTEYVMRFVFLPGQDCVHSSEWYHEKGQTSLPLNKMLKKGETFEHTFDTEALHKQVMLYGGNCHWKNGAIKARLEVRVPGKSGEWFTMSTYDFTINAGTSSAFYKAHNKDVAASSGELVEVFTSGNYANTVNNPALNTAIEQYMETKWPSEDITTVNVTYYAYTNTAGTAFKFEGAYITRKKDSGKCKYNTCYGKGTTNGSTYSINFFNSMTAEKEMDCGAADQLKNR